MGREGRTAKGKRLLRAAAIHEAGHVVAGWAVGISCSTTIVPRGGALGFTRPVDGRATREDFAVCAFGGAAASLRHDPDADPHGFSGDEATLGEVWPDPRPREARAVARRTQDIIDRHWARVERLASALLRHRRLTAAQVRRVLGGRP
jgi:ATP-dependent Zn protease